MKPFSFIFIISLIVSVFFVLLNTLFKGGLGTIFSPMLEVLAYAYPCQGQDGCASNLTMAGNILFFIISPLMFSVIFWLKSDLCPATKKVMVAGLVFFVLAIYSFAYLELRTYNYILNNCLVRNCPNLKNENIVIKKYILWRAPVKKVYQPEKN